MGGCPRIYGWLLVGTAKRSRLTAVQDGRSALYARRNSARQHAHTRREWSARTKSIQKMALCATGSFMLGEVTAPKCYHQAKVSHKMNPRKIELLQDVFV